MFDKEEPGEEAALTIVVHKIIIAIGLKINPNPRIMSRVLRKEADKIDKITKEFEMVYRESDN